MHVAFALFSCMHMTCSKVWLGVVLHHRKQNKLCMTGGVIQHTMAWGST